MHSGVRNLFFNYISLSTIFTYACQSNCSSFFFARLFPWETPDGSSRQRRRQNNRNSNESSIQKTVDIFSDSTFGEEDRKNSTGVPVSHSTPVGSSGTTEERNETRKTPVVVAAVSDFIIAFVSNCSLKSAKCAQ